jgi:hypothetical protein
VGALLCLLGAGVAVAAVRKIEHAHHGEQSAVLADVA